MNEHEQRYRTDRAYKYASDNYSLCFLGIFLSYLTIVLAFCYALWQLFKHKEALYRSHFVYIACGCVYYTALMAACFGIAFLNYRAGLFTRGYLIFGVALYVVPAIFPFWWWVMRFVRGNSYLKQALAIPHPFLPTLPRKLKKARP